MAHPKAAWSFGPTLGDYIEGACRNRVAYIHYPANHVSKQDSGWNIVKQQDNFVSKITLP